MEKAIALYRWTVEKEGKNKSCIGYSPNNLIMVYINKNSNIKQLPPINAKRIN